MSALPKPPADATPAALLEASGVREVLDQLNR